MSSAAHRDAAPAARPATTVAPSGADLRRWPRSTTLLLLLLGVVMGAVSFAVVMSMPRMVWHPARDAELGATYAAYVETGTLLIKETGSGSYGVQAPADGPLTFATWDDDPGSYIIASLMSHVTGSDSPYPGLKLAQAVLVAIPLLWLPLAVARVVGSARAGFALVVLPLVTWLFNYGTVLAGTEYGLSDRVSPLAVYSLYGTAASLAFLSLSLVVLLSTYRLRWMGLIGATVGIGVLAAFGNLSRSLSGIGVAAAVGVLWWIHTRGRWRWLASIGGAVAAILLAVTVQTGIMTAINVTRADTTGQPMEEVPDAHTAWHSLYLGLSYPQPLTGQPSRFDVTWSDEFAWAKAREVEPDVLVASEEYDQILRGLYLHEVLGDPVGAIKLYIQKAIFVVKQFGGLLLFIAIGFIVGMARRGKLRSRLWRVIAIVTPLVLLGLLPAVLVMPMLYYYSELSAALGLLAAVALGVLAWAVTSWPSRVRAAERRRTGALVPLRTSEDGGSRRVSAILRVGGSHAVDAARVDEVAATLTERDEIVLVFDPESDISEVPWHHACTRVLVSSGGGAGSQLRAGVRASAGDRVQLFIAEEDRPALARSVESLRKLLLGTPVVEAFGAVGVEGPWVRRFAAASRETDALWFDELEFAAAATSVPLDWTPAGARSEVTLSRGRARREWRDVVGFARIALNRADYGDLVSAPRRNAALPV
ncbi:hypothetical protein [Microbacterium sp. P5_E9]